MFKKIIYFSSLVSLSYADSLVYTNPSLIHTLSDKNHLEVDLTSRYNPSYDFDGSVKIPAVADRINVQASSQKKVNFMPQAYYVAPKYGDFRFGLSITPYMSSTRKVSWSDKTIATLIKDYDVSCYAFTPTVAYKLSDTTAVATSLNIVKAKAFLSFTHQNDLYSADLKGTGTGYSYGLSFSTMLRNNLILTVNGDSKTNVKIKGSSTTSYNGQDISSDASVGTVLPSKVSASLILFLDADTSFFGSYKKSFWSQYKELDLNFENKTAESVLGKPTAKNWRDSEIYALGYKQRINNFTGSAAIGYAKTPVNPATMEMSIPAFDNRFVAFSGDYKLTDALTIGAKLSLWHQNEGVLDNQVYKGTMGAMTYKIATVFFKTVF